MLESAEDDDEDEEEQIGQRFDGAALPPAMFEIDYHIGMRLGNGRSWPAAPTITPARMVWWWLKPLQILSMSPQRKQSRGKPSRDYVAEHSRRLEPTTLRIIGGRLRGRKLLWSGQARTRPMKDRVRQAMFDLIGPSIRGVHAIDLFAGSGALALEAISRGAVRATLVERHFPTAKVIEQNIAALSVRELTHVIAADTFIWAQALPDLGAEPWVVFCSPPYRYYQDRLEDMLELVETFLDRAPRGSIVALEADRGLDISRLPQAPSWMVRSYPPAIIAIHRSPADTERR